MTGSGESEMPVSGIERGMTEFPEVPHNRGDFYERKS